jgi:hypothetical protein
MGIEDQTRCRVSSFIYNISPKTYKGLLGSTFAVNFCENVPKECNGEKGTIIGYDQFSNCKVMAGDSINMNTWKLKGIYFI